MRKNTCQCGCGQITAQVKVNYKKKTCYGELEYLLPMLVKRTANAAINLQKRIHIPLELDIGTA